MGYLLKNSVTQIWFCFSFLGLQRQNSTITSIFQLLDSNKDGR